MRSIRARNRDVPRGPEDPGSDLGHPAGSDPDSDSDPADSASAGFDPDSDSDTAGPARYPAPSRRLKPAGPALSSQPTSNPTTCVFSYFRPDGITVRISHLSNFPIPPYPHPSQHHNHNLLSPHPPP